MNKNAIILAITAAAGAGLIYYYYHKKQQKKQNDHITISLDQLIQLYRGIVTSMEKIFKIYMEQKKRVESEPLETNVSMKDIESVIVFNFRKSLGEVEDKYYSAFGFKKEDVQTAVELYQSNPEFLNVIKSITIWAKILGGEPLPFPALPIGLTQEVVRNVLTAMENSVPDGCDEAVTQISESHKCTKLEVYKSLRDGGAYAAEFAQRRESISIKKKLDIFAENNVSPDDFQNAMEQFTYDPDFSERIKQFLATMQKKLQSFILLSAVSDVVIPEALDHTKLLEIYQEIFEMSRIWCRESLRELCEALQVPKQELGKFFESQESAQKIIDLFSKFYTEKNETGRDEIYKKYNYEKLVVDAAIIKAKFDETQKDENFLTTFAALEKGMEDEINAALTSTVS